LIEVVSAATRHGALPFDPKGARMVARKKAKSAKAKAAAKSKTKAKSKSKSKAKAKSKTKSKAKTKNKPKTKSKAKTKTKSTTKTRSSAATTGRNKGQAPATAPQQPTVPAPAPAAANPAPSAPSGFQVVGTNANALFTLKLHRGEGMTLIAMNWKNGQPPQNFVGFAIEYQEPGGNQFFALNNRLGFLNASGNVDPTALSTLQSPIQKFRWVHFPRNADLAGNFQYRVTPMFMDAQNTLSKGVVWRRLVIGRGPENEIYRIDTLFDVSLSFKVFTRSVVKNDGGAQQTGDRMQSGQWIASAPKIDEGSADPFVFYFFNRFRPYFIEIELPPTATSIRSSSGDPRPVEVISAAHGQPIFLNPADITP
jgi:hypothetical protein